MQPSRERRIINAWGQLSPWGKFLALVSILHRAGAFSALLILAAGLYALATVPPLVVLAGVIILYVASHPRRRPAYVPRVK